MWEAGGKKRAWKWLKLVELFVFLLFLLLYVAWKRGLPPKCAHFVLFRPIKKHSFNLLCALDLFSEHWQSTLFQIIFKQKFPLRQSADTKKKTTTKNMHLISTSWWTPPNMCFVQDNQGYHKELQYIVQRHNQLCMQSQWQTTTQDSHTIKHTVVYIYIYT